MTTGSVHLRPKHRTGDNGERYVSYYYAEFYDAARHPAKKRVSLHTSDKSAARLKLSQMQRDYYAGLFDPWRDAAKRDGVPVSRAVKGFLKGRAHLRPKSLDGYEKILRIFRESLPPGLPFQGIEERHVTDFLDAPVRGSGYGKAEARKLSARSRQTYTTHLRAFFRWAVKEGLRSDDPTEALRAKAPRRAKSRLPEFLTDEEFARLLRGIEADAVLKPSAIRGENLWLSRLLRFTAHTGLRRGEVCNLRWSAVNLDSGFVTVRNTEDFNTKSGHERSIYLAGDARRVIEELHATRTDEADGYVFTGAYGHKLNERHVSRRFADYRDLAGLPSNLCFHSLRHTFASWFVLRGGDLYRLKEILGHSDISVTQKYAHLRPDAIRQDMERLFGDARESQAQELERLRERCAKLERNCRRLRARLKRQEEGRLPLDGPQP